MALPEVYNDGGMTSRKFRVAMGGMLLVCACWGVTARFPLLAVTFDSVVGAILGIIGLYLVGNVSSQWVTARGIQGVTAAAAPTTQILMEPVAAVITVPTVPETVVPETVVSDTVEKPVRKRRSRR